MLFSFREGCETWWGGWLQTAKEKVHIVHFVPRKKKLLPHTSQSASALEFVKKDLAEFSTTMQTDTAQAAESVKTNLNVQASQSYLSSSKAFIAQHTNASAATERVKRGMSSLLDGITRVLTIPPDDDDDQVDGVTSSNAQIMFDRTRVRTIIHLMLYNIMLIFIIRK